MNTGPAGRVSLRTLAEAAGVSKATVSYALRGSPKISAATRSRIVALAAELGYQRRASGAAPEDERGPRHDGRPRIAWLGRHAAGERQPDPGQVAAMRARDIGYRCERFDSGGIDDLRVWRRELLEAGFRGLVLAENPRIDEALAIDWAPLAVVCCDPRGADGPYTSIIDSDPLRDLLLCHERALAAGYRRIGTALDDDDPQARLRLAAVHAVHDLLGEDLVVVPPQRARHKGYGDLLVWYRQQRPDVVIGPGLGHFFHLRRAGIVVPFICQRCVAGDSAYANFPGIVHDRRALAATAINAIDQQLRFNIGGRPPLPRRIGLASRWQDGAGIV